MESNVLLNCYETEDEMERIPKGAYTPEFRAQAVRLIEEGAAMTEALCVNINLSQLNLS